MPNNPTPAPPADDLAQKCREMVYEIVIPGGPGISETRELLGVAADELDRLKAENAALQTENDRLTARLQRAAQDWRALRQENDGFRAEVVRLSAVEQAHRELVSRVDAWVASQVIEVQHWDGTCYMHAGSDTHYPTRAEAEAAYRERAGFPPAGPAAPADQIWHAFHHAWTAAVGTPKYDKSVWKAAEAQLLAAEPAQPAPSNEGGDDADG